MRFLPIFLLACALSACSTPPPRSDAPVRVDSLQADPGPTEPGPVGTAGDGERALAASRQRWEAERPADYRFTYTRNCFCPPQYRGPFEVTVRGGEVTDVAYKGEGEPVDRPLSEYQTVDDLL